MNQPDSNPQLQTDVKNIDPIRCLDISPEAKEMPKLEELAHATEETLVDVLGFPEQEGLAKSRRLCMYQSRSNIRSIYV